MVSDETINPPTEDLPNVDADATVDEIVAVVDPLVAERDAALAQRDEYKDIALRLQADFENYRVKQTKSGGDAKSSDYPKSHGDRDLAPTN